MVVTQLINPPVGEVFNLNKDPVQNTEVINISPAGMRIDRDLYKSLKEDISDKQSYETLY